MVQLPFSLIGFSVLVGLLRVLPACAHGEPPESFRSSDRPTVQKEGQIHFPRETRLKNVRQLTFGGTNAEAYWSFDGKWLAFQHKGSGFGELPPGQKHRCDQIYRISSDGRDVVPISKGLGRTTCSYALPDDERVLFSTTYNPEAAGSELCPPEPDHSQGYVWPIYPTFRMVSTNLSGDDLIPMEPAGPTAYNAEATVCKDGSVVFTSDRDGDLELYTAKVDRRGLLSSIRRVTHTLGYDGGAFFSPDCSLLVWRASRPKTDQEKDEYLRLLKAHLVKPSELEIIVANADGSEARTLTHLRAATFAPYFTPDQKAVLFSSNVNRPGSRQFDLFRIELDGTHLEQVTYSDTFDSFPMFSPDGKTLAFSSNRNAQAPRETNLFLADWVNTPPAAWSRDDRQPANRFAAYAAESKTRRREIWQKEILALGGRYYSANKGSPSTSGETWKWGALTCKKKSRFTLTLSDPSAEAAAIEIVNRLKEKKLDSGLCLDLVLVDSPPAVSTPSSSHWILGDLTHLRQDWDRTLIREPRKPLSSQASFINWTGALEVAELIVEEIFLRAQK